ncbi:MAG: hypothetical protein LC708_03460 [Actinobacteria bacterium]|nr:hypothetical protein [Actinomycetota bacterium]
MGDTGTVTVIDNASDTVVDTVSTTGRPNGVAVAPDSARVYVALSNGVAVVDTDTNTVVDTVDVPNASGVAIGPVPTVAPTTTTPVLTTVTEEATSAFAVPKGRLAETGGGAGARQWGLLFLVLGGGVAIGRSALRRQE